MPNHSTPIGLDADESRCCHELDQEVTSRLATLTGRAPLGGLRFSGTGRVRDPGELHDALSRAFVRNGGEWRREAIVRVEPVKTRARLHLAEDA